MFKMNYKFEIVDNKNLNILFNFAILLDIVSFIITIFIEGYYIQMKSCYIPYNYEWINLIYHNFKYISFSQHITFIGSVFFFIVGGIDLCMKQ